VAIAREPEHPVRDRVDECLEAVFTLTVEPDQEGDRDRGRRRILDRQQQRPDIVGHFEDPANAIQEQGDADNDSGDEDRQEIPTRPR
jgi:hypothetical protein